MVLHHARGVVRLLRSAPLFHSGSHTSRSGILISLAVVFAALLLYMPGLFTLPAIDRDESRFAQASRQMAESGNLVVPMVQGKPRLNKPPLIYWLQAASASVMSGGDIQQDAIWMYRVPSWLAAAATVMLVWQLGRSMYGVKAGLLAAAMFAVAPVILWESRQARADSLLVLCSTLAMASLWWRVARGGGDLAVIILWAGVALGVMTKGPITPMIVLLTLIVLRIITRQRGLVIKTAPLLGIVMVLGFGLPWLLAVMNSVGADVYIKTIYDETLGRSVVSKEGHSGPPGYHVLLMPALFFPGSLALGAGVLAGSATIVQLRQERRDQHNITITPGLFLLAWLVPAWIIFELVKTKLPHYTMPLYPALALLCAGGLVHGGDRLAAVVSRWWARIGHFVWTFVLCGFIMACAAAAAVAADGGQSGGTASGSGISIVTTERNITLNSGAPSFFPAGLGTLGIGIVAAGILFTACVGVAATLLRSRPHRAVMMGCVTFAACSCVLLGAAPHLTRIWTTSQIMRVVKNNVNFTTPIGAVGYHEDSLIFATRGAAQRLDPGEVAEFVAAHPGAILVCEESLVPRIPVNIHPLGSVTGFNYSKGKWVYITIGRATPKPAVGS